MWKVDDHVEVALLHLNRNWVVSFCGGCGGIVDGIVCVLAVMWFYGFSGIACRLLVGFRWLVNILLKMGILEELDGAVVAVSRPLLSSLASNPLKMHTCSRQKLNGWYIATLRCVGIQYITKIVVQHTH